MRTAGRAFAMDVHTALHRLAADTIRHWVTRSLCAVALPGSWEIRLASTKRSVRPWIAASRELG